jgi:hypothetical protein
MIDLYTTEIMRRRYWEMGYLMMRFLLILGVMGFLKMRVRAVRFVSTTTETGGGRRCWIMGLLMRIGSIGFMIRFL